MIVGAVWVGGWGGGPHPKAQGGQFVLKPSRCSSCENVAPDQPNLANLYITADVVTPPTPSSFSLSLSKAQTVKMISLCTAHILRMCTRAKTYSIFFGSVK